MKADPIQLAVCLKVWDCLSKSLHLTVGVRDKRRHVTEESYEVRRDGEAVLLTKDDGETYTLLPGGRCDCKDADYRSRPGGCKHLAAARLAGLLGAAQVRAEKQTA